MPHRTIEIECDSPAAAKRTLRQIGKLGFPIEEKNVVRKQVARIRIDIRRTHGVHHPMNQIISLGLSPIFTSKRK